MRNLTALVIVPAVLLVLIGCDLASIDPGGGAVSQTTVSVRGGVDVGPPPPDGGDGSKTGGVVAEGPPGILVGRILFDGAKPSLAPKVVQGTAKADPTICAKDGNIPDQSLVVGDNGGVANVFVYLSKAPKGVEFEKPETQPFLDQKACVFGPHALLLWSGLDFELKNSDKVPHNVQTFPARNSGENNNLSPGASMVTSFRNAEPQPFPSKCAIHPWMEYWTLVVDHPFAAVTDADGKFKIPDLPPGKYKFRVFHERGALLERGIEVVVQPETETTVEWKYGPDKFKL